jgi:molybdopterin converting factor small subunit
VKLTVRLYATLRELVPGGRSDITLDMPDGATVADVIARLGVTPGIVRKVFVAGVAQDSDFVLYDGAELGVFPPIAGG